MRVRRVHEDDPDSCLLALKIRTLAVWHWHVHFALDLTDVVFG